MRFSYAALLAAGIFLNAAGPSAAEGEDPAHAALKQAVLDGKDIHMTLDLAACKVHGTEGAGPAIQGSLSFEAFMVQADQTIAFSQMHATMRPDNTAVNEFLSFRVNPDGAVDARMVFLNPATFAVMKETHFDCRIGKGAAFHW